MSIPRLGWLGTLGVAVVLLSGCGAMQPGVAAQVGEDTITVDQVDELTVSLCAVLEELP